MDGNDNILHITPVSSVMFRDKNGNIKLVRDDIELALVTVEAYRFSIGNPMKRRRIVTLIGAGIAAAGLGTLPIVGNPLISGGLVGLGAAISGLAYLLIKPKPVKILAKMHVPILVAPYSNGSIIALPEKFKSFSGSSLDVKKVFVSFPVANVEGAKKIADEIPMDSESFNAEIMAVELMNKITEIITPARGVPYSVIASTDPELVSMVSLLLDISKEDKPSNTLNFEDLSKVLGSIKGIETSTEKARTELEILETIKSKTELAFEFFEGELEGVLKKIDWYFSEIRKIIMDSLIGNVNIYAIPTKDELENHGYKYVTHRYHINLDSKYPRTSLVAVFQKYITEMEKEIRDKVSEYNFEMKNEIDSIQKETQRRIDNVKEYYGREIRRAQKELGKLRSKALEQERKLENLERELRNIANQIRRLEREAEEYEEKADQSQSASERRSYLSRAKEAWKAANKLRNDASKLQVEISRLEASYQANLDRISELEAEIENLQTEMEHKILELKTKAEFQIEETKRKYSDRIREVRKKVDELIEIRDDNLEIVESFYETVLRKEQEYQEAPIKSRLERLRRTYGSLVNAIMNLKTQYLQFIRTATSLVIRDVKVARPTVLYVPIWVIVSEKGDKKLIPFSKLNSRKKGELLTPASIVLSEIASHVESELLKVAENINSKSLLEKGKKNLDILVRMGIITKKEAEKIKKALG